MRCPWCSRGMEFFPKGSKGPAAETLGSRVSRKAWLREFILCGATRREPKNSDAQAHKASDVITVSHKWPKEPSRFTLDLPGIAPTHPRASPTRESRDGGVRRGRPTPPYFIIPPSTEST